MTRCAGCDAELIQQPRGRPRKWCSDKCRKRSHDSDLVAACNDCGVGMTRAAFRKNVSGLCADCFTEARRRGRDARDGIIADLWEDGATCSQIADAFGWSVTRLAVEFARIRKRQPELLPYRRTPEQVDRIRAGWQRVADRRVAA